MTRKVQDSKCKICDMKILKIQNSKCENINSKMLDVNISTIIGREYKMCYRYKKNPILKTQYMKCTAGQ